jgi:predicted TIM-barrel fold metal-dependent hydrolase
METASAQSSTPVINCHTHIFTGDCVPPWLARTIVPWPFYFLFPLSLVVSILRYWFTRGPYTWQFKPWYKLWAKRLYFTKAFLARYAVLNILRRVLGVLIVIYAFYILYDWLQQASPMQSSVTVAIDNIRKLLSEYHLLLHVASVNLQITIVASMFLFVAWGRNLILFLLERIWSFLGVLPGKQTKQLLGRYINIGRYARYERQDNIFRRIKNQYPEGTGFVVLPMDMEFMGAGKVRKPYRKQMEELATIKASKPFSEIIYPFVFVDPRRIAKEPDYFRYQIGENGKIVLDNCFIKEYIETHRFSGFKIYPALGYYPFDEGLLPVWKYAADNGIPVLTHCIRGTIYYRGTKQKEWDTHPVFEQAAGKNEYEPLILSETKNQDFCNNFTHPLNYLCILEQHLLKKLLKFSKDEKLKRLFGYINDNIPLQSDLSQLKLCFGHFGGDDEWKKYFESDRDNYTGKFMQSPGCGISLLYGEDGSFKRGKPEQLWKNTDWYSLICSMMLQYPNVYADISYILHDTAIMPLLKQSLHNDGLCQKVLYGTDFYVVRNHKSDKNMLADMMTGLTDKEFMQIAVDNPKQFLSNKLHV